VAPLSGPLYKCLLGFSIVVVVVATACCLCGLGFSHLLNNNWCSQCDRVHNG
jgi:hypothetical protein